MSLYLRIATACLTSVMSCGIASAPVASSNVNLAPVTDFDEPGLSFDFPGLLVGVAEYAEGPAGTTVFAFPGKVKAAVDVRGGSPVTGVTTR